MDIKNVTETIAMIEEQNFDIRTITMGISLLDCIDPDINKAAEKIYAKITDKARDLVKVGNEISAELGIPIVNKRVCVTPIAIISCRTASRSRRRRRGSWGSFPVRRGGRGVSR